jgi:hypothetical protein
MGGLPALDTFPRFTCPQIIPHKLAFLRLAHLCTPCTDHPCSNCSENLPGCSFQRLFFKYASRTSVLLSSKKWRLFQVLFVDFCQNCPPSHFMHRNAPAVYMDFCHILGHGEKQPKLLNVLTQNVVIEISQEGAVIHKALCSQRVESSKQAKLRCKEHIR